MSYVDVLNSLCYSQNSYEMLILSYLRDESCNPWSSLALKKKSIDNPT